MTKKQLIKATSIFVALFLVSIFNSSAETTKPNIIVFMADDMGIGDTSAYLDLELIPGTEPLTKTLSTPKIERFAKEGITFTDAHAPASMCSSTRYSLLTGRLSHRSYLKKQGWLPHGPNRPMIHRDLTTLPEMLKRNGYSTAAVGKYHVGMDFDNGNGYPSDEFDFSDVDFTKPILDGPTHHGFDEFFGVPGNTEDSLDTDPRIYIRDDNWVMNDRSKMKMIGMKQREGEIIADPDWDLAKLGPDLLKQAVGFIKRRRSEKKPFFLYYVPCANHFQRNPSGDYAVPESIDGQKVKGQSRYTDDSKGGEREDMILENDIAFGALLKTLRETDDPRNPGHKMIENTLVVFTSDNGPNVGDNEGQNQQSGRLRGKKAKVWEGGHRVPFILYWKNNFNGGGINSNLFSLTDLFATFAQIIEDELNHNEAQDSLNSLKYWKDPKSRDPRPRYFFCHLGPPYENDAIAIRQLSQKVIVQGGLVQPWTKNGSLGSSLPVVTYNLNTNPYEMENFSEPTKPENASKLAAKLLKIHNQGFSRELNLPLAKNLILDDGWHNLRNDLTGTIGYEFELLEDRVATHLGMWDDHDRENPVRAARSIPEENQSDQPSRQGKSPRTIKSPHTITLWKIDGNLESLKEIDRVYIKVGKTGELDGEFRFLKLDQPIRLTRGSRYVVTMDSMTGDGDHFHDPVSFDGISPLVNPSVRIIRSVMFRNNQFDRAYPLPSFTDLDPDYSSYRLPVGPTIQFE